MYDKDIKLRLQVAQMAEKSYKNYRTSVALQLFWNADLENTSNIDYSYIKQTTEQMERQQWIPFSIWKYERGKEKNLNRKGWAKPQ